MGALAVRRACSWPRWRGSPSRSCAVAVRRTQTNGETSEPSRASRSSTRCTSERGVRAVAPVADVRRHQPSIELAMLYGGAEQPAVLVPRASRWLSRRYRIGVQLVGGDHPRHAGFLEDGSRPAVARSCSTRSASGVATCGFRRSSWARRVRSSVELDLSGLEAALEVPPKESTPSTSSRARPRRASGSGGGLCGLGRSRPRAARGRRAPGSCRVRAPATTRSSSTGRGSAPAWANTPMPSLKAMIVGIDVMFIAAASCCCASVSTFANVMSGFASAAAS